MSRTRARLRRADTACGREGGFTLIEMLVTIALLVIILYLLAATFRAASIAFHSTRLTVGAHQNARSAMDLLHDDLVGARLVRLGNGVQLLFEGADGGANSDTLTFTTTAFQSARSDPAAAQPTMAQIVQVQYYVDGTRLMKRVDWDGDLSTDAYDAAEVAGFDVTRFDVRYLDRRTTNALPRWTADGAWLRTENRLPAAVEITLVILTTDNTGETREHRFSQVVYLPNSETQGT